MTGFLVGAADCGCGERPRKTKMPEILAVRLEHRSPPRPRSARQAGERESALSGTTHSHAAAAGAIAFKCCRLAKPDHRGLDMAEGGTAHGLAVRFCLVRIEGFV